MERRPATLQARSSARSAGSGGEEAAGGRARGVPDLSVPAAASEVSVNKT